MNEFNPTGKVLGEGGARSFFEVELATPSGECPHYAATRPRRMWKERFVQSAEFELSRLIHESSLKRKNHRLVLPLAFQKVESTPEQIAEMQELVPKELFPDEDLAQIELYYPLIADGNNLLDVVMKSEYENAVSYLPLPRVLTIIQDVATGIDTLNKFGFVSNDIKLSNILVEMNRAWVADFNNANRYEDNSKDRRKFFHLVQMLLVGREVDTLFLSARPKCTKENFIQGLSTLDDASPSKQMGYALDTDETIRSMMLAHYSKEVQLLIDKYWEDSKLPLVVFAHELSELLKVE
jgi:serine/threonine protein kinase